MYLYMLRCDQSHRRNLNFDILSSPDLPRAYMDAHSLALALVSTVEYIQYQCTSILPVVAITLDCVTVRSLVPAQNVSVEERCRAFMCGRRALASRHTHIINAPHLLIFYKLPSISSWVGEATHRQPCRYSDLTVVISFDDDDPHPEVKLV